ncbi:pyridoxal phosphate-dependent transferase [Aspergillus heterothallicus]
MPERINGLDLLRYCAIKCLVEDIIMAQRTVRSKRSIAKLDGLKGFGLRGQQQPLPKRRRIETPIDLSIAENWSIRPELVSLFQNAIQNHLDSHLGDTGLMHALSTLFNEHFDPHSPVKPSHIALAPGSSSSLAGLVGQICDPREGVLVPAPFWNGFDFHFTIHAQVHPVIAPIRNLEHAFDANTLIESLTTAYDETPLRIRAVVLTTPGNPLGQCYTKRTLELCAQFCQDRGLHLICDEVYALSYFAKPSDDNVPFRSVLTLDLSSIGCDPSRIHMVWSLSKDFGCSGLRLGCVVSQANPDLILALQLPSSTEVSALTSLCATALLTSPTLPNLVTVNRKRLDDSYKAMATILQTHKVQYIPATAGLFVFARLRPNASPDEETKFQQRLKSEGIAVSPGQAYHAGPENSGWYRLTFALPPAQLKRALAILDRSLRNNV